jgi:hypothetical protein
VACTSPCAWARTSACACSWSSASARAGAKELLCVEDGYRESSGYTA